MAIASALTVGSALSLDVAAGTGPVHITGLAVLAVGVGALRIALVGRHQGLFATLSAALVAQPAVHALGEGFDPAHAHAPTPTAGHAVADSVTTAIHLALAGLMIVAVGAAEWMLELAALTVGRILTFLLLVLRGSSRRFVARPATPTARRAHVGGVWIDYAARRGPPRRALTAPV
ncbi:hypothetical protein ACFPK1_00755 [Actinomycetospora rhizophila]|uniref:Integral membrane protein n=1 Tax=Actinomycetospora rhizophila TaxID=1416876 RepID=A0ABV9Z6Z2_9PSEU